MKEISLKIKKEVSVFEEKANSLIIENEDELNIAVELLSNTNRVLDKLTDEKNKVARPLLDAINAERVRWKPFELSIKTAIDTIRQKMTAYKKLVDEKRIIEEERILKRVEKGSIKVETAVNKLAKLPEVQTTVSTSEGSIQWRGVQRLVVDDISLVPHSFFDLNEKRLLDALKAGFEISGAHIEIEKIPANYR